MNFQCGVQNMAQVPANKGDSLFMRLHGGRTPLGLFMSLAFTRGCAVPGATPGSGRSAFPTPQGVVPFMPTGGAISKGGMESGSRVWKKSPPVRHVQYPDNSQTPHATRSVLRHNPVGVVYIFGLYPG